VLRHFTGRIKVLLTKTHLTKKNPRFGLVWTVWVAQRFFNPHKIPWILQGHTLLKVITSGDQTILWFESNHVLFLFSPKSKSFNNYIHRHVFCPHRTHQCTMGRGEVKTKWCQVACY
jgi:hypothetical protein